MSQSPPWGSVVNKTRGSRGPKACHPSSSWHFGAHSGQLLSYMAQRPEAEVFLMILLAAPGRRERRLQVERPWSRRSLAQEPGPLTPLFTGWVNHSTSLGGPVLSLGLLRMLNRKVCQAGSKAHYYQAQVTAPPQGTRGRGRHRAEPWWQGFSSLSSPPPAPTR